MNPLELLINIGISVIAALIWLWIIDQLLRGL